MGLNRYMLASRTITYMTELELKQYMDFCKFRAEPANIRRNVMLSRKWIPSEPFACSTHRQILPKYTLSMSPTEMKD